MNCARCVDPSTCDEVCEAFGCTHYFCLSCLSNLSDCPLCYVNQFQIFIRNCDGSLCCMNVWDNMLYEDFEKRYCMKQNIAIRPKMIYSGRIMKDGFTLSTYGVDRACTVHVSFPLRGD